LVISIALLILCLALVIGIAVPFAFFASVVYLIFAQGYEPSFLLPYGFSQMSTTVLLAIPLFIMAGGIMEKGRIAGKLIDLVEVFVGKIKGGLGAVAVVSCAVFGSITGSAAATLTCVGTIILPRLKEAGYSRGYASALISNSSVLGMLIPPSAIMILYAWIGGQSVLASFLATVVPGIILLTLLIIINTFYAKKNNAIKQQQESIDFNMFAKSLGKKTYSATPALALPLLVLGGIYGGIMTPTEAAGIAVLYAVPVGFFIYKGLDLKSFKQILIETATTTGVIMVMLYAVMILSRLYIMEDLPGQITSFLFSISENKYVLLILINLFMVIIGMLMDDVSAVLLSTPVLLPVVTNLGVDPIHFAAIVAVNLGMGNITPPTAPLLYLGGRIGKAPINEMLKPTMIMILFAWLPTLILTTYLPEIVLYLPEMILGK
jgi:C4-dicarboxylate transporter, DctM subunit